MTPPIVIPVVPPAALVIELFSSVKSVAAFTIIPSLILVVSVLSLIVTVPVNLSPRLIPLITSFSASIAEMSLPVIVIPVYGPSPVVPIADSALSALIAVLFLIVALDAFTSIVALNAEVSRILFIALITLVFRSYSLIFR